MSEFINAYVDPDRAAAYSTLGFAATYTLAFRDLPALFAAHGIGPAVGDGAGDGGADPDPGAGDGTGTVSGGPSRRALDFGCGAGRSTRFLRRLGYDVVGVDVSAAMLARARAAASRAEEADPAGVESRYLLIDDDPSALPAGPFDLILAAYPFDNIPGTDHRVALLTGLRERLAAGGRLVLIASSPELYVHEWATFTTAAWPENAEAGSGDRVRIAIKEGGDPRPVDDFRWFDRDYRAALADAGLEVLQVHRPLATGDEPFEWVSETEVAPWVIYVTGASSRT